MERKHFLVRTHRRIQLRITRLQLGPGVRLALAGSLGMVAGRVLGLHAFYWSGISAIVVSTGTASGSFKAGLNRTFGTLVGLGMGMAAVALAGHTLLAASLAIFAAILACQLLGLKKAFKIAALTTLFPVTVAAERAGLAATLTTSLSRAANVLTGSAVALAMDTWDGPERIASWVLGRVRQIARA